MITQEVMLSMSSDSKAPLQEEIDTIIYPITRCLLCPGVGRRWRTVWARAQLFNVYVCKQEVSGEDQDYRFLLNV